MPQHTGRADPDQLGVALRTAAVFGFWVFLAACGDDGPSGAEAAPTTVLIAVSESGVRPAIGETEASGVFAIVRYVLANGADKDVVVSQDDITLVIPGGSAVNRSERGTKAWAESPGGYALTDTVLLKPGGMPRPWVSVFDVPEADADSPWTLRYRNEPPVDVPAPSR